MTPGLVPPMLAAAGPCLFCGMSILPGESWWLLLNGKPAHVKCSPHGLPNDDDEHDWHDE